MKEITAYLCEATDNIYRTEQDARRADLHFLMRKAGRTLPVNEGVSWETVLDNLSGQLYHDHIYYWLAFERIKEAIQYFDENFEVITGRPTMNPLAPAAPQPAFDPEEAGYQNFKELGHGGGIVPDGMSKDDAQLWVSGWRKGFRDSQPKDTARTS